MSRPTDKRTLLEASAAGFAKLLAMVEGLPASALDAEFSFEDRDRNVRDVLGHLHAWHGMMERWYHEGMAGQKPAIPAPGHTWRTLPALNHEVWRACQARDLSTTRAALAQSHERVRKLIAAHSDAELFTKQRYAWTGSTSLGAFFVSATSSHYEWAMKKLKRHERSRCAAAPAALLRRPSRRTSQPVKQARQPAKRRRSRA